MKKIVLFITVGSALCMSSCKKDRTCTCTLTDSSGTSTSTYVVKKATKKSLKAGVCYSGTVSLTFFGATSTSTKTCTIK